MCLSVISVFVYIYTYIYIYIYGDEISSLDLLDLLVSKVQILTQKALLGAPEISGLDVTSNEQRPSIRAKHYSEACSKAATELQQLV